MKNQRLHIIPSSKTALLLSMWVFLFLAAACSDQRSDAEKALETARQTAENSYQALLDGHYDQFLANRAGGDSLPESYREQLITTYKQFAATQQEQHGGIRSFNVSNARIDSTQQIIQVFLMLNYADSTREEIVIPMVEHNGVWKMK